MIPSRDGVQAFLMGEWKPSKDTLEGMYFTTLKFYSNNKMSPGFEKKKAPRFLCKMQVGIWYKTGKGLSKA